jgi:hypothetical protein
MRKKNPRAHGPPNSRPSHPRAELRFAQGAGCHTGKNPPRSRAGRPSGEVPPRSGAGRPLERDSASLGGWTTPRARSSLDRELDAPSSEVPPRSRAERALERVSVSLKDITGLPPPYLLPRQGHLMHWHSQARRSKTNPCHDAPGNHTLALFCQLPRQGHPRHCVTL